MHMLEAVMEGRWKHIHYALYHQNIKPKLTHFIASIKFRISNFIAPFSTFSILERLPDSSHVTWTLVGLVSQLLWLVICQINDLSLDSEQNDLWLIDLDLHEMTCYQRKLNV